MRPTARGTTFFTRSEGADEELAELAALLHDVDDPKLFGEGSGNARRLLKKYAYPDDVCRKVADIIGSISFKGTGASVPGSLEGKAVQDADRLDAIGAVGIARAFAYGGSKGRALYDPDSPPEKFADESEYRRSGGSTVNHFYEKLLRLRNLMNTETARKLAEERHDVMLRFLERFCAEWNGDV